MRDIAFTILFLVVMPLALIHSHVSIYLWLFVTYFPPQYMAYGFAQGIPWSFAISLLTIFCWLISREPKTPIFSPVSVAMYLLVVWVTFTTYVISPFPEVAHWRWDMLYKTVVMVFFITVFAKSKVRLQICAAILMLTMTYFAIRTSYAGLGGMRGKNIHGPGGFLGGNNEISRAFIFALAMAGFLLMTLPRPWMRWPLIGFIAANGAGIMFCMSRGGWLGGIAMFGYWIMFTRYKFKALGLIVLMAPLLYWLTPDYAIERFLSITETETDGSTQGRFGVWAFAFEQFFLRPIAGGGPGFFDAGYGKASHNIYIQMMGENGIVGIALWMTIALGTFITAGKIKRRTRNDPEIRWAGQFAFMIQCSLVGFMVGGFFENHGYFPIFYHVCGFLVVTKYLVDQHYEAKKEQPAWKRVEARPSFARPAPAFSTRAAG